MPNLGKPVVGVKSIYPVVSLCKCTVGSHESCDGGGSLGPVIGKHSDLYRTLVSPPTTEAGRGLEAGVTLIL